MKNNHTLLIVALLVANSVLHSSNAIGQTRTQPPPGVRMKVESANELAKARLGMAVKQWRARIASLKSKERLLKMGREIASIEEKIGQGLGLLDSSGHHTDRMRDSFRRHIVNEQELANEMTSAFNQMQKELMTESIALYVKVGVDRKVAGQAYRQYKVDSRPWQSAFDPLIAKARSMAKEDWFRLGMVTVAADTVSDGVSYARKQSGIHQPKEGGFWDFLIDAVTALAVEVAIDHVTDPSEAFAKKLEMSFAHAEQELLDGKNGLLTAMRTLTEIHQQGRLQHLGLAKKGVK